LLLIPTCIGWQILHLVDQLLEMLLSTTAASVSSSFSGIVRVGGCRLSFVRATATVAPSDHARKTTLIRVCFTFRGVYLLRLSLLIAGCIVGLGGRLLSLGGSHQTSSILAIRH